MKTISTRSITSLLVAVCLISSTCLSSLLAEEQWLSPEFEEKLEATSLIEACSYEGGCADSCTTGGSCNTNSCTTGGGCSTGCGSDGCGLGGGDVTYGCGINSTTGVCDGRCKGRCQNYCNANGYRPFLGIFKSSDHCFDGFISPITNPTMFEDPRTLTEVRSIFIHQSIPNRVGGGEFQMLALQARVALTERLSFISTKSGYFFSDSSTLDDGWSDVNVGLKYNFYRDVAYQQLISAGMTYEFASGQGSARQSFGDGQYHIFASAASLVASDIHWMASTGVRFPNDKETQSSLWYISNHIDKQINQNWYILGELNIYRYYDGGQGPTTGVAGMDLFNFGSRGINGSIATGALGVKYKPNDSTEIGFAYEMPVSSRHDILNNRLTVDWIWRF